MRVFRLLRLTRRGQTLIALSTTIFIYTLATSMMQYGLSLFTDSLATNYTFFGFVMGLPWIFSLLTDMPIGAFADHFGRKRTILVGLLGLAASGVLLYFSDNLIELFISLVVFGIFEGFLTVAGMAAVISSSPEGQENQFVGGYQNASGLGYFIGPILGGFIIAGMGFRIPFLIFSGICGIAALFTFIALFGAGGDRHSAGQSLKELFRRDKVYGGVIKEFFSTGPLAYFVAFSMLLLGAWNEFIWALEPILVKSLHNSAILGGAILSAFVLPIALFDYSIGRWIDRTQKRFLSIFLGLIFGGAGIIAFSLVKAPILLIFVAFLVSFSFAFSYVAVNGLFDTLSTHHRRGYMSGAWQASEDVGFIIGPILGGILADLLGLRGAFIGFGALFFVAALWVLREKKNISRYEKKAA